MFYVKEIFLYSFSSFLSLFFKCKICPQATINFNPAPHPPTPTHGSSLDPSSPDFSGGERAHDFFSGGLSSSSPPSLRGGVFSFDAFEFVGPPTFP